MNQIYPAADVFFLVLLVADWCGTKHSAINGLQVFRLVNFILSMFFYQIYIKKGSSVRSPASK